MFKKSMDLVSIVTDKVDQPTGINLILYDQYKRRYIRRGFVAKARNMLDFAAFSSFAEPVSRPKNLLNLFLCKP